MFSLTPKPPQNSNNSATSHHLDLVIDVKNLSAADFKPGVLTGNEVTKMFAFAAKNQFAIPAINCSSSSTINAVLEAAGRTKTPVIIQFSHGGAQFLAGKGLDNSRHQASVAGAVSGAYHVHQLAHYYGATVMLHTDHCDKDKIGWVDGLLKANLDFFDQTRAPLFSSHMLDLSQLDVVENVDICRAYLQKMAPLGLTLEIELGITGGEEDGVDNSDSNSASLYTQPEEVSYAFEELLHVSSQFTIAASFGNVHGVYRPGNVKLRPEILRDSQNFIQHKFNTTNNPVHLVFHGGSGSETSKIQEAIGYGVVKMNVDTDMQWAYWDGVRGYEFKNRDFLQAQIGNPTGEDQPNKNYYDPRKWTRAAEESMIKSLDAVFEVLKAKGQLE